jgi:hypothetical protein
MPSNNVSIRRPKGKGDEEDEVQELPVLPEPRNLSKEQRVALYGAGPGEEQVLATLSDAASGVGMVALQYIAETLKSAPRYQMTVQDRMAMQMAPTLSAEVKRKAPAEEPGRPGGDPIKELLTGPSDAQEETVRMSTSKG